MVSDPAGLLMDPSKLSDGEKQLLCLGRALLTKRPILILDEVSAQLDVATENKILTILNAVKSQLIILAIGHREQFMDCSDFVLTVANGGASLERVQIVKPKA